MKEDSLLVSDTTFKYMFKHEIFQRRMIRAIKHYTNINLSNYELINNEINTGTKTIKDKRMDLVFKGEDHFVIIEMEQFYHDYNEIKDYGYLYSVAGTHSKSGEEYKNVKTTLILFANYVPSKLKNMDDLLLNYRFKDELHNMTKEDIESYEFLLPNLHKMNYNECNEHKKFLWLFSCNTIEEMKSVVDNDEDKEIIHELERLNMDENFRFEYDAEQSQKMMVNSARKEGIAEGIEQGIEQERINSIKVLSMNGISDEKIAESYGLTIEEVKEILENNK